ncbi:MAG TPA: serine/threonine protein kinase [Candidatus Microbacterium pullistercoris]|nr:serine/threonine protein kinase [Candidatus Microbacterium pullistercoris]
MNWRLSHYRVEDPIGIGSFATVYRAVDERLDDTVAIKILAENHSLNPEIRERFIAEGRSLRRVGGAHVAAIHDIGESAEQQPYLVLEYADRRSLDDRVAWLRDQGWRASPADLLAVARPLAAGVEAVHRARLVHRDLSPRNLLLASGAHSSPGDEGTSGSSLVRDDERLLLADLGMCKDLALNSGLTVAGGTSGFRPPEQDAVGVVNTQADIWAMSALLTWLAEGAAIPPELRRVLSRGMSVRPERRQLGAQAWLREVEAALAPPAPTAPVDSAPAAPPDPPRPTRAWRSRAAAIGAVLLALAGALTLGLWLGDEPAPPAAVAGASISISGPSEIDVGEEAIFTATVDGVTSWSWSLPTQRFVTDSAEVTMVATSPGTGEVVLRSRTSDGVELEARHIVRVVE